MHSSYAGGMTIDADLAEAKSLFWYSSIELAPNVFTRAPEEPAYWTMGLTRQLMERIDLRGKKCLDVGAVDGFMATVMAQQGAEKILATDCCDYSQQINLIQRLRGAKFQYLPSIGSLKLVERMIDAHKLGERFHTDINVPDVDFGFDFINCSGVMYHLYSPLHLLGALRTLVRPGGLVVIETAFIPSQDYYMSFNYFGGGNYIYAYSDTWFITPPLMDYLLRMFSLQPLDVLYRHSKDIDANRSVGRGAIVCRAVDSPISRPEEIQMAKSVLTFEFDELYKRELEVIKRPVDMPYTPLIATERDIVDGVDFINLAAAVEAQRQFPIEYERAVLRL